MIEEIKINCSIDDVGFIYDDLKQKIIDPDVLEEFFIELKITEGFQLRSKLHGTAALVEAFDSPIIAHEINLNINDNSLTNIYGFNWSFDLSTLLVDEWDRFHGTSKEGLPFVMNAKAQDQFFDQLEEFDDDSITFNGKRYLVNSYWNDDIEVESESYWTDKYDKKETGWDLGAPALGLLSLLPKLKLPTSRIIILGGGCGHDAALFAEHGHLVTLVDVSAEAISKAKQTYGHYTNLTFIHADLFDLPHEMYGQFDILIEHTCYCAINPSLRSDLVKQWRRLLHDKGFLFAIFFIMPKRNGPPFGGSEFEIKERLKSDFQFIIWQRFRQSVKSRSGRELLVYAQKRK